VFEVQASFNSVHIGFAKQTVNIHGSVLGKLYNLFGKILYFNIKLFNQVAHAFKFRQVKGQERPVLEPVEFLFFLYGRKNMFKLAFINISVVKRKFEHV